MLAPQPDVSRNLAGSAEIEPVTEAHQVFIGLVNPKTPVNVGGIMRASGCYGVDGVFYTGRRYELAARSGGAQYHIDTKDAGDRIPLTSVTSLLDAKPEGAKLVCVDLVLGATPLPEFIHPANAFYVFGPEDGTISQEMIDCADAVVYVPTVGCMNLAASVNVLLYDRLAKRHCEALSQLVEPQESQSLSVSNTQSQTLACSQTSSMKTNATVLSGDALIRQSRDNNNRTRVKNASVRRPPRAQQ